MMTTQDKALAETVREEIRAAARRHGVKPSQVQDLTHTFRSDPAARAARVDAIGACKARGVRTFQLAKAFDFAPNTITAMAREWRETQRESELCHSCAGTGQLQSGSGCDSPESHGAGHAVFAQCPACLGTGRADV